MPDADTDPAARRIQVDLLRRMGPEGRLALALDLCDEVRAISETVREARRPRPGRAAAKRERIRLYYGVDLPTDGRVVR